MSLPTKYFSGDVFFADRESIGRGYESASVVNTGISMLFCVTNFEAEERTS